MFNLGLIPARKGSKRIPQKNLKKLNNKPLIQYTIEAALRSKELDMVLVSTDCEEIAKFSKQLGVHVPFLRPEIYAKDKSTDFEVINHTIKWLLENESIDVTNLAYLRPTTPLKNENIIDEALKKSMNTDITGLRTVTRTEGVLHPYWMYFESNQTLTPVVSGIDLKKYYQSQLLPKCYRLNGVVDIVKTSFISEESLYGNKIGFLEVDEKFAIDIDTLNDFNYCEYIMSKMET